MGDKLSDFKVAGNIDTTISAKILYMLLSKLADEKGTIIISQRKISKILGIHKSTVSKSLRRLERSGDIYIRSRYTKDGGRLANEYVMR